MSSVRIVYTWVDGSSMAAQAWADDTSPVAMAIARTVAVEALFESLGEMEADDCDADADVLYPPSDDET